MNDEQAASQRLREENAELRVRLNEAEDALRAIREGDVDAIVVSGSRGEQLFSLAETENIYRLMVETMNEAGLAVSPDGLILFANQRLSELLGTPIPQLIGRPLQECVLSADRDRLTELLTEAGETPGSARIALAGKSDSAIPVYFWASFLAHPGGAAICLVGTDLRQLEASQELIQHLQDQARALLESEERYRTVADFTGDWEFWRDPAGRFVYVSPSVEESTGYTRDAFYSEPNLAERLVHPDDRETYGRHDQECHQRGFAGQIDFRIIGRDGRVRWIGHHCQPVKGRDGRFLGHRGCNRDVTDRVTAEEALRDLNESLEGIVVERTLETKQLADRLRALASELSRTEQRERKRLASVLHDHIQQLLVAARLQLSWARHSSDIVRVQSSLRGADSILKEAIDSSRSLTVELSPPVLHEAGLCGGLNWLAARMADKHHFTVHLQADNQAEPTCEDVRLLLFECVRELLFNAAKHSGVSEANVTLMRCHGDHAEVIVQDAGRGFDPAQLDSKDARSESFGLFSIQQRLAYVGGTLEIDAAPGMGACIKITAPIGVDEGSRPEVLAHASSPTATKSAVSGKHRQTTVLVVDDHQIVREGLIGLLQLEPGIQVIGEAADGPQAISLAAQFSPDVIIMDVELGGMSGIEATRAILERNPAISIIGLSMFIEADLATAMRDAGAIAYLTKGGAREDLIAVIRNCRKGAEAEHARADEGSDAAGLISS